MEMPLKQRNFVRQAFEMPEAPMDAIDRRIVAELQAAPRLRVAELARRIGLSGPAVADRLRRLEESGTLTYRAEVDPRALGYTLFAIVRISPVGGGLRLIPGIAQEVPNVTECYRITGEDCYFMKVYLHSIDDLEPILDLFTPHGRTTTSIVHSAPVPPRPLPVPLRSARTCPTVRGRARPCPGWSRGSRGSSITAWCRATPRARSQAAPGPRPGRCRRRPSSIAARVAASSSTQRPAPGARRARGIGPAQSGHEPGQVTGGLALVRDQLIGVRLAVDPPVDRPGPGIPLSRAAPGHRLGDAQRQARREPRQPVALRLQIPGPPGHARQPSVQVVAQPVDGVHRPGGPERSHLPPGQPRELRGHQPANELGIDVGLVVVHLHGCASVTDHDGCGQGVSAARRLTLPLAEG